MELSIFLAKWLGLYMLILAAIWIIRKDQVDLSFKDMITSKGLIAFSGLMNILLGLAIAIGHPIWQLSWVGLITLLGYLMIITGIMRLVLLDREQKYMSKLLDKGYWPMIAVLIIIGAFLTYHGFMAG